MQYRSALVATRMRNIVYSILIGLPPERYPSEAVCSKMELTSSNDSKSLLFLISKSFGCMLFEQIDGHELHRACLCLLLPQLPYHTWLSWSPHLFCQPGVLLASKLCLHVTYQIGQRILHPCTFQSIYPTSSHQLICVLPLLFLQNY